MMTPVYMFNERNKTQGGDVVSSWSDVTLKGNLTLDEAIKIHGDKVYKLACLDIPVPTELGTCFTRNLEDIVECYFFTHCYNPNQLIIVAKTNDRSQFYWNSEIEHWVAANEYTTNLVSRSAN
jgi:hypothetical protein